MVTDCTDCEFMEYEEDGMTCTKGHELLMSLNIPDDCKDFKNMWSEDQIYSATEESG